MSATPRLVPDHECKQRQCANRTTGCWDVCLMRNPGWAVAPDTPVAEPKSSDFDPVRFNDCMSNWGFYTDTPKKPTTPAATLPAAPAPTERCTKDGCTVRDNGVLQAHSHNNGSISIFGPLPAEQAGELPPLPPRDGDWAGDDWFTTSTMQDHARAAYAMGRGSAVRDYVCLNDAALTARQAPTELRDTLIQLTTVQRQLIDANAEIAALLMGVHPEGRRAPDSRDAALTEAQINTIKFAADALEGLDYEDTDGDLRAIAQEKAK